MGFVRDYCQQRLGIHAYDANRNFLVYPRTMIRVLMLSIIFATSIGASLAQRDQESTGRIFYTVPFATNHPSLRLLSLTPTGTGIRQDALLRGLPNRQLSRVVSGAPVNGRIVLFVSTYPTGTLLPMQNLNFTSIRSITWNYNGIELLVCATIPGSSSPRIYRYNTTSRTGRYLRFGYNAVTSPNGQKIVFAVANSTDAELKMVNADGTTGLINVTGGAGVSDVAVWSPNGVTLVLERRTALNQPTSRKLYTVPSATPGTTPRRLLVDSPVGNSFMFDVSPDSRTVVFVRERTRIYTIPIGGGTLRLVRTESRPIQYVGWLNRS
jgi:hypothetical protein